MGSSIVSGFSVALAISLLSMGPVAKPIVVHAQGGAGQAFSIAPPLLELQADPGQILREKIQFTNISASSLVITAQANDFGAKDENGTPNILLNPTEKSPYSLSGWLKLPGPQTLKSGEMRKIDFSIAVPKSAEPGGHYGVIRFSGSSTEATTSGVALSASLGSLILLRVSGNLQERASLADFYSAQPKKMMPKNFFEQGPIGFVVRASNNGNVHFAPTGTLTVKNTFGKKVAALRINGAPGNSKDPPKNVLPASIRRFQVVLDKKMLLGRYTAQLDLTYGQSGKHLMADKTFWVIPYRLLLGTLLGLIVLAFALRIGLKKYNAHIIKKATTDHPKN